MSRFIIYFPFPAYFDMKTKACGKRPCPAGWLGDYYPHCTVASFQRCSEEFPGVWPNCNIYDQGPRLDERRNKLNFVFKEPQTF